MCSRSASAFMHLQWSETTGVVVNYNGSLSANHRSDPSKQELTFDLIIVINPLEFTEEKYYRAM